MKQEINAIDVLLLKCQKHSKKQEKEKIKKQFEELTTQNKGQIDIEKIKKLFPDDEKLHKELEKTKNEFEKKQQKKVEAYERDKFQRRSVMKMKSRPLSSNKLRAKKNIIKDANNNDIDNNIKPKKTKSPKMRNKIKEKEDSDINIKESNKKLNILDIPKIKENEVLNENKIQFLLDDYKSKLMKEFLLFCDKEKEAENERREIFAEAKNEKEKKRLQKIFEMQNAQSADKIGEYNNLIDEKITQYEKSLKQYFKNHQKK